MPETSDTADPVVVTEQTHLEESRAALKAMREEALTLRAEGGNAVSTENLLAALRGRAKALMDDPNIPLFFGRLDYGDSSEAGEFRAEHYYIGRRHVHDGTGEPMVIDWRAPVSTAFYRATPKVPMGLDRRRRFGFAHGAITGYEDEPLSDPAAAAAPAGQPGASRILTDEIERPRSGPMRDIVSTIQPEQDEIVRADVNVSVCVQGAPGTGKTAVGLHRVAFLLYAHRDRLRRGGSLVVGPNKEFLKYIEQVLPALGEIEVGQTTVDDLVARVKVTAQDPTGAGVVKGDARMAEVLRTAIWSRLRSAQEALPEGIMIVRGSRRWRVPAHEIDELIAATKERDVRYGAGRAMLAPRIAHTILYRMEVAGETTDDRTQNAVARTSEVRKAVDLLWPAIDPVKVVFELYANPEVLAAAAEGILTAEEQESILWTATRPKAPRTPGTAKWSSADAVLVDEAHDQLDRLPSLAHVVLDEAQDLSAMQYRAVGRRCSTGSVTVLGDIAQGTTPWATPSWSETLKHLGKPEAVIEELTLGFRVPRQIIDFAAKLLPDAAPGLLPPTSVRQQGGALEIDQVPREADLVDTVVTAAQLALAIQEGSVGLITADSRVAEVAAALAAAGVEHSVLGSEPAAPAIEGATETEAELVESLLAETVGPRLAVVPATLAKGLEYDQVLVVEPAEIVAAEPRGLRRLYVVLTRAVSRLHVVHSAPLPAQLTGAGF
ncbi:ATP-dependent DNA helicase [Catenulispora acidiphila DSM 44928]|uniref:ATP-dependent DNA helicase n=1 Tax=Catenulispora acidiphila (strain DSM 44928 / JCM 14897 / NBRC 102108 / NRRL B-24433 / ID139908) TaxID=479433 RepID=C7QIN1_CATAD|nr:AAA family ATPase [Catenulispora acidiphila]ACU76931.1 ATP-dependent DNA helicase [Catenulispora acidiphila DSM 44928]